MDKIKVLRIFVTVVDTGSFVNAAGQLGLSPSTVSKAILRLESRIGFKLLNRNTRQICLTEPGKTYFETVKTVISQLRKCEEKLRGDNNQSAGTLHLNVPVSYGRLYILPFLAKFKAAYPLIKLDITFSDKYVDMIDQGIDVCIRSGQLDDSRLIARQLSPIDFLICASPSYLNQHGIPKTVNEFHQHPWIRFRFKQSGCLMPIMLDGDTGPQHINPSSEYIVDDGEALMELCASGLGLTQAPHFIAHRWIMEGKLHTLLPYHRPTDFGVFAIYIKKDFLPAKIRVFIDCLQDYLQDMEESPYHTWAQSLQPISI